MPRPQPEPPAARLRPTAMKTVVLVVAALLLVTGCGSEGKRSTTSGTPSSTGTQRPSASMSPGVGACPPGSPQVQGARSLATVDLDGDGKPETVRLTAPGGKCGDTVFARVGEGYAATRLSSENMPVTKAYAVAPPGASGQLLVTRADSPRGGYQLRVYGLEGSALRELTVGSRPLVPFVVLEVQEHPFTIDCADGGFVLTEAVTHQPVGVVAAWDIKQTAYTLDGTHVTAGPTKEVADNVLPPELKRKYAALEAHAAFASCRA